MKRSYSLRTHLISSRSLYPRYRIVGYSPKVAHKVAICSAITSKCADRCGGGIGL